MTTSAEQFADILREQANQPDVIGETVIAVLTDQVMPDGTPITSANIGRLMAAHADQLEAQFGGDQ